MSKHSRAARPPIGGTGGKQLPSDVAGEVVEELLDEMEERRLEEGGRRYRERAAQRPVQELVSAVKDRLRLALQAVRDLRGPRWAAVARALETALHAGEERPEPVARGKGRSALERTISACLALTPDEQHRVLRALLAAAGRRGEYDPADWWMKQKQAATLLKTHATYVSKLAKRGELTTDPRPRSKSHRVRLDTALLFTLAKARAACRKLPPERQDAHAGMVQAIDDAVTLLREMAAEYEAAGQVRTPSPRP
jgi:hypothetical protein